ncbi:MAG: tetratricopeptide repeat protein, partial [Candidatus Rokuibacteriota bacterium]
WSNLGTILAELGRAEEARQALAHAVEVEPDNPRLLAGVAQTERTLGQHDAAARHLLEAARVAPAEFRLAATLGVLLLEQGRRDEAQTWFERSRPEDADYGEGRLALARDRSAHGDVPGATAALHEALGADPVLYGRVTADPGLAPLLRR